MNDPLYPPPLKKGDTIGIIAPAGQLQGISPFRRGVDLLCEMGFQVKFPQDLWPGTAYLADNDANRADEFNRLFQEEEVKGLVALRGGYGSLRMLAGIDLALVTSSPKILVGFSDITILLNFLHDRTGLVSCHGPVVTSLASANKKTLTGLQYCMTHLKPLCFDVSCIEILRDGPVVAAPLIGGNLASLVTLIGTPHDFSWKNKIVFLEDINEPVYKVDRMLTQLKMAGKFDNIAGLILGSFSMSTNQNESEKARYREAIWNRVLELCPIQAIPVWGNFPAGHHSTNLTFPLGAVVEMQSSNTRLHFR